MRGNPLNTRCCRSKTKSSASRPNIEGKCKIFRGLVLGLIVLRRYVFGMRACVHQSCNRDEQFAASFHSAQPYPHVAIPEFFSRAFAAELAQKFPSPEISKAGWFLYNNPIEIKFANNDRASLPACFNSAIDLLNSEHMRSLVSAISGVPFLEEVIAMLCFDTLH